MHAPLAHAWLVQDAGKLHCPLAAHVCTPLPEHCVMPGVHVPAQTPPEHVPVHGVARPHCPVARQVRTPLDEHWVAPGEQTPVQAPLAHAWFVHAAAVPHVPSARHV